MKSLLGNTRKPDIIFNSSGRIDISVRCARPLKLEKGDVIDVTESESGEYYLYVKFRASIKNGKHEASVFPSNKKGHHFRTSSRKLCNAILKICGETERVRLCIGEPVENSQFGTLLPLIIKYHL